MTYGMLIDVTRCTGCETCVKACVEVNGKDPLKADYDRAVTRDGLSENRFTTLLKIDGDHVAKKACMHCLEPSCVAACLCGGLTRNENGIIEYHEDICIGCRYCMLACPFHIPRYEWDKVIPYVQKCQLCKERLAEGEPPACVEACPHEALAFGSREEMLELAHSRIDADPARYLPHVWGETEFGGTAVLYISDVDLHALGFPGPETPSIPSMTSALVHATPYFGSSVLAGVFGLNWIIQRRMKLMSGGDGRESDGGKSENQPTGV